MKEIKSLTPFKHMCMSIGNLPSSYIDSMSYYETLLWLIKFLQNEVIPTVNENGKAVEELQELFIQLKNYVDNYLTKENLQPMIDDKLDEFAEDGTLEQIIAKYINNTMIRCYANVSQLKQSNLSALMKARTLGYYDSNDEGGALYLITNTKDSNGHYEDLDNGKYAKLIIENDTINVKQLGAKGDGTTDDTDVFDLVSSIGVKNIIIPNSTYLIEALSITNNLIINGCNSTINCKLETQRLCSIGNNCTIKNLNINCLNINREWNYIDLSTKSNILLEKCSFNGFRQVAEHPNCWALYIRDSKNIKVTQCSFDNNNFQDILIDINSENIILEDLIGSDLKIDIEPYQKGYIKNVTIKNTKMTKLWILENNIQSTSCQNVNLINCEIRDFHYKGGNVIVSNCLITNYIGDILNQYMYAGCLKFVNSACFSNNLIDDPYIDSLSNGNNSKWKIFYTSSSYTNLITTVKDNDGIFTVLNQNNTNGANAQISKDITVKPNSSYYLTAFIKNKYPASGVNYPSHNIQIRFYVAGTEITSARAIISVARNVNNTTTPLVEQSLIFNTPSNCDSIKLIFKNGGAESSQSTYIKSVGLYEIYNNVDGYNCEILPFENRTKRIFNSSEKPSSGYNYYNIGDILYYENPSEHVGSVCTSSGYNGTWRDF